MHLSAESVHKKCHSAVYMLTFAFSLFLREDTSKLKWSNNLYDPAILERTDCTIGIGFLGVKGDFLLKVQIPKIGVTTALRGDCFVTVETAIFQFLVVMFAHPISNTSLMHFLDHSTSKA